LLSSTISDPFKVNGFGVILNVAFGRSICVFTSTFLIVIVPLFGEESDTVFVIS
jgi:hypothetical protein